MPEIGFLYKFSCFIKLECQKKYAQAMKLVNMGFLGVFVPKCKMNGDFEQIQCLGSINMCWCVEEKTGKALEGTYKIMTDSIQPNCAMTGEYL